MKRGKAKTMTDQAEAFADTKATRWYELWWAAYDGFKSGYRAARRQEKKRSYKRHE